MFNELQKEIHELENQLHAKRELLKKSAVDAFNIETGEYPIQGLIWNYFHFDKPRKWSQQEMKEEYLNPDNIQSFRHMKFNGIFTGSVLNDFYNQERFKPTDSFITFASPDEDSNYATFPIPLSNASWLAMFKL